MAQFFCLAVVSALFVMQVAAEVSPVPLFLWSPERYFTHSKCDNWEVAQVLDLQDVAGGMRRLGKVGNQRSEGKNVLLDYLTDTTPTNRPEAVVAFVYDNLGSTTASAAAAAYSTTEAKATPSLQYLQRALGEARSCVSVPFVKRANGARVSETLMQSLIQSKASNQAQVVALQLGHLTCDSVLSELEDSPRVFDNHLTDLILLHAEQPNEMDAVCMERILNLVGSKTNNNFVALLSADTGASVTMEFQQGRRSRKSFNLQATLADGTSDPTDPPAPPSPDDAEGLQYVTAPILSGLMLGFLLLMFLWVGVSCLMSIDTPQRYATENLGVPKEY